MKGNTGNENSTFFLALKRRLTMMGYTNLPLGLDSAPLVHQMLEDLVATTTALRESEDTIKGLEDKLHTAENQLEPLQSEITRMTRDNVQLHQQIVQAAEEASRFENQHTTVAFELQAENRRLTLLHKKASQHIKKLKKENDELNEKLQKSIAAPTIMKNPEFIEVDPRKMRQRGSRTSSGSRTPSLASIDTIKSIPSIAFDPAIFEAELSNLRNERDEARKQQDVAMARMSELEEVVKIRDEEIIRLGNSLQQETGKDGYLISLRHKLQQCQDEIEKLRAQVRVVNPSAAPQHRIRQLYLVPARATFHYDGRGQVAPEQEAQPKISYESVQPILKAESSSIFSEEENEEEEEDIDEIERPRDPVRPEPLPVQLQPTNESSQQVVQVQQAPSISPAPSQSSHIQKSSSRSSQIAIDQQFVQQLFAKDQKIQEQEQEIKGLQSKIEELNDDIAEKEKVIASMSSDFAFIHDNLESVIDEKNNMIISLQTQITDQEPEVIQDTEEIEKLQFQIEEMKINQEKEISSRDTKINQLQDLIESLSKRNLPEECSECIRLKQQLESIQKQKSVVDSSSRSECEKLKSRISQLEVLIRATEGNNREFNIIEEQLKIAKNQLTEKDTQIGKLHSDVSSLEGELKKCKLSLEEAQKRLSTNPDIEQKYRILIDQFKQDRVKILAELKQKSIAIQGLGEKLTEAQRIIRELKMKLSNVQDENKSLKEDAEFHRAKSEEITHNVTDKSNSIIKEANSVVQHLQRQLQEKTNEAELMKKLLTETRKKLANVMESIIPEFKRQISKEQKEKLELINKIKRICRLAFAIEHTLGNSPDAEAFNSAIHQIQTEL